MKHDTSIAAPRVHDLRPRPMKGMDISKIARPGSLDILQSPSRVGKSLFYPNGEVAKDDPAILKD